METLEAFIAAHPSVPPKPRGDSHHISLYVTRDEAESLSHILQDHRLFGSHAGSMQELLRWMMRYFVPPLLDLLDDGYRPLSELLRAEITSTGIGMTVAQVRDYFTTQAAELRMLLEVGELERMFDHYEHVTGFVKARDGVWAALMLKMLRDHGDITAWREQVRRLGGMEEARLRLIEGGDA